MPSAYMPLRTAVYGTPDSASICSVTPWERACRNVAPGPAFTNEIDDLGDAALLRGLDERAMERDATLGAFVHRDHEDAVALVKCGRERVRVAVVGRHHLGAREVGRARLVADDEAERLAALGKLLGHEPADVPGGAGDHDHGCVCARRRPCAIIESMSVEYGSAESMPYVCAVFVCRECGRTATRHGRHVEELPAGWVESREGADVDHACGGCAGEAAPPSPARAAPSAERD